MTPIRAVRKNSARETARPAKARFLTLGAAPRPSGGTANGRLIPNSTRPVKTGSIRAVSLFSGAGGFCEGARLAGWHIECAVESDKRACATYAANFDDVPLFKGDIAHFLNVPVAGVPTLEELVARQIDVVYGGPPCQGFSQIGPRDPNDLRNRLYLEFVSVVRQLQPRAFVMENVPNMLAMDNGRFKASILNAFHSAGFERTAIIPITASDYGVPQRRRRIFIFGIRDGLHFRGDLQSAVQSLLDKQKAAKLVTVWQALSDLPEEVSDNDGPLPYPKTRGAYSSYQNLMRLDRDHELLTKEAKRSSLCSVALHNHHTKNIEQRRKKIIAALAPGARGDSLPPSLWNGSREHKWRRLDPDKPSYTILAQMHRDLSEWIHPTFNRWITVREAARLQSFHDGFVFVGSELQQLKQVGNAVPPLMALAVARATSALLRRLRASAGH